MGRERLAAVGAFVIGGLVLFAAGLFLIGDRRMLFTDTFRVYAEFRQVAGLDTGAKVRVAGIDAGEVEEIRVPLGPSGRFRVRMRVRSDLRPLIRIDSIALIQNDGLVGNKFVQIQPGTDAAPTVAESGTIQSREPFDIGDLMVAMSDTLATVNTMLAQVKGGVDDALGAVTATALDAQTREELQDELLRIHGQTGKTIVFVTHSIEEGVYLGNRVIVLRGSPSKVVRVLETKRAVTTQKYRMSDEFFTSCKTLREALNYDKG